jgi:hypothetical protein
MFDINIKNEYIYISTCTKKIDLRKRINDEIYCSNCVEREQIKAAMVDSGCQSNLNRPKWMLSRYIRP